MNEIKINKQITFLRKKKGMTQEEMARALGVTNQAVSKWESAQCCPDIQLLPDIARLFQISVDHLLGYETRVGLEDICLKMKEYFSDLPEKAACEKAYRIAALLHEVVLTDGYKKEVPWKERDYSIDEVSSWGKSVCFEEEGGSGRKNDSIFFALGDGYISPNGNQLYEIKSMLERLSNLTTLKVLYSIYGLTVSDFNCYVMADEIAIKTNLSVSDVENALRDLPVKIKEDEGVLKYRLEESYFFIPSLLSFFTMI